MCIYVSPGSRQIATEDIHVWKAIAVDKNDPDHWFGPFKFEAKRFNFNETIENDVPDESSIKRLNGLFGEFIEIGAGFFHSCESLPDARARCVMTDFYNTTNGGYVVKAIIPKGAVYYTDYARKGHRTYASSSIIVNKPK